MLFELIVTKPPEVVDFLQFVIVPFGNDERIQSLMELPEILQA